MNRSLRSRLDRLASRKSGTPQPAMVEFDDTALTCEQAIEMALERGFIEPGAAVIVFPKTTTTQEWESMIPLWQECLANGSKWDEVPYWAGGGAMVPKLKFDDRKTEA